MDTARSLLSPARDEADQPVHAHRHAIIEEMAYAKGAFMVCISSIGCSANAISSNQTKVTTAEYKILRTSTQKFRILALEATYSP